MGLQMSLTKRKWGFQLKADLYYQWRRKKANRFENPKQKISWLSSWEKISVDLWCCPFTSTNRCHFIYLFILLQSALNRFLVLSWFTHELLNDLQSIKHVVVVCSSTCRRGWSGAALGCWGRCCSSSWFSWRSTRVWPASRTTGTTRRTCWQDTCRGLSLRTGWSVFLTVPVWFIGARPHVRVRSCLKSCLCLSVSLPHLPAPPGFLHLADVQRLYVGPVLGREAGRPPVSSADCLLKPPQARGAPGNFLWNQKTYLGVLTGGADKDFRRQFLQLIKEREREKRHWSDWEEATEGDWKLHLLCKQTEPATFCPCDW